MRVLRVRRRAEAQALVTLRELHVEVRHQRLDEVVATDSEMEWTFERQILLLHCVQVDLLHQARVRHDLLRIDDVNCKKKTFSKRGTAQKQQKAYPTAQ